MTEPSPGDESESDYEKETGGGHGDDGHEHHDHDDHDHHHGPTGWRYWMYTTDHKVIGIIYLAHGLLFLALGGLLALIFRTELALGPGENMIAMDTFNTMFTIHGITMIFLVILPISGAFANYLIPLMTGCEEMAYPRMNALGAWGISAGGTIIYLPFVFYILGLGELTGLPSAGGWFHFAPLSIFEPGLGVDTALLGITVFGITSTGGSINFMVTVLNERDYSMGWTDIPLFVWALGIFTSSLAIFAVPFLLASWGMTFMERNWSFTFFDATMGGAPLLYQWVFWIFGHPEVYVLVLPAMGIVAEVVSRFSERPIYGYNLVLASFLTISIFSCLVWAHHMYNTGLAASRLVFMVFSMGIAISFGVYIFCMIATMYRGRIHLTTPMLFSIGVIVGLIYSGMEGIMLGQVALNIELHNTYFVVGHFHFTLFMVGLAGLMAGIYYWYPLMFGRMYNSKAAKYHALTTLFGLPALFMAMGAMGTGILGTENMMRRYATYTYEPALHDPHIATTVIAFFVASGQAVFLLNLALSLRYGPEVVGNPWDDLMAGQNMPTPEYDGFPYKPNTPANVYGEEIAVPRDGSGPDRGVAADGGYPTITDRDDADPSGGDQR